MRKALLRLLALCLFLAIAAVLHSRAQDASAPERGARPSTPSPGETLRSARTLYVEPGRAVDAKYLQYKLLRADAFADWNISIVENPEAADLILAVEQVRLNYIFRITDPRTSRIVASGKVVAINDPVAADFLGKEIVKRMREARRGR